VYQALPTVAQRVRHNAVRARLPGIGRVTRTATSGLLWLLGGLWLAHQFSAFLL
jgi:hypothetical protein